MIAQDVAFQPVGYIRGSTASLDHMKKGCLVVETEDAWKAVWEAFRDRHRVMENSACPQIDFATKKVIVFREEYAYFDSFLFVHKARKVLADVLEIECGVLLPTVTCCFKGCLHQFITIDREVLFSSITQVPLPLKESYFEDYDPQLKELEDQINILNEDEDFISYDPEDYSSDDQELDSQMQGLTCGEAIKESAPKTGFQEHAARYHELKKKWMGQEFFI